MKRIVTICIVGVLSFPTVSEAQEAEPKDTRYFSGMPNFRIVEATDQEFADYNFFTGNACTTVEGEKLVRIYTLKEDARLSSELQISRNYANAIRTMGGTVVFEGECSGFDCAENCGYRMMVGTVTRDGDELWLEVLPFNDGNDYYLTLVVKQAMRQDVTASDMFAALSRDGRIALYILFDTGRSTITPESRPIIDQIVAMLRSNPELGVSVEGHTDSVGSPQSNRTLSGDRANAVVAAIVAQGIDAGRLSAVGHGQDRPIADNGTEEGRAKNRRVDLVRK